MVFFGLQLATYAFTLWKISHNAEFNVFSNKMQSVYAKTIKRIYALLTPTIFQHTKMCRGTYIQR